MASPNCYTWHYWSVYHCVWSIYIDCVLFQTITFILSPCPLSFNVKFPMLPTGCNWWLFEYHISACLKDIYILGGILISYTMALLMNDAHIIYHHMDASWSVGLVWSYFQILTIWQSNVGFVLLFYFQSQWLETRYFHFIKFFPRGWVRSKGTPCHYTKAIIDVACPFVISAYFSPLIVNNCHFANNVSGVIKHPCNNCMFFSLHTDELKSQWYCLSAYYTLLNTLFSCVHYMCFYFSGI